MSRIFENIYKKVALISPWLEVALRRIYWNNIEIFKKLNPHNLDVKPKKVVKNVNFNEIIEWYKSKGIGEGDLLIVHSSFTGLISTGLTPDQVIDLLLELIGPSGTLAMPVIRIYKEEPKTEDLLKINTDNLICTYDVKRSPVSSGLLPFRFLRRKDVYISHHPLNPMCAVGPLAKKMMENNLNGDFPSPHGPNSSWRFCFDNGAKVVSLGVNIEHYNTIVHVADESFDDWKWSDEEWYRHRIFDIVDEQNNVQQKIVSERKPEWGLLHFTEIRLNNDLKKLGIMQVSKIKDQIEVGFVDVNRMIAYLRSKKDIGYPYYV